MSAVLTIRKKSPFRYEKLAGAPLVPGQLIMFDGEFARLPDAGPAETNCSGLNCSGFILRAWTIPSASGGVFVLSEFFQLPKEAA